MSASIREVARVPSEISPLIHLAWSLDREVSLSSGYLPMNGTTAFRFVVRVGVDTIGIAQKTLITTSRNDAEELFAKAADSIACRERLAGGFGGTAYDPDSIDVELAR